MTCGACYGTLHSFVVHFTTFKKRLLVHSSSQKCCIAHSCSYWAKSVNPQLLLGHHWIFAHFSIIEMFAMNGIERYSKYIAITEHVIVGSLALAALNILVQDGVSGVSLDVDDSTATS